MSAIESGRRNHEQKPALSQKEIALAKIHKQETILAESKRSYSKEQAKLWRTIPSLLIECEGRSGYLDSTFDICNEKLYPILSENDRPSGFVDLTNGELIERYYNSETKTLERRQASDNKVITINKDLLDAEKLVENLINKAQQPPRYGEYQAQQAEKLRDRYRRQTNTPKPDFEEIQRKLNDYKGKA